MQSSKRISGWVLFWIFLVLIVSLWLGRWRYEGNQTHIRTNRFSGERQEQITNSRGEREWVPIYEPRQ